jgi:hypothetical protein
MRSYLWAAMLALFPAAISAGQPPQKPGQPVVDAAAAAKRMEAGRAKAADPAGPPQANGIFAVIDADGDGTISKVELRKAIKALRTLDTDNDGNITLAEASLGGGDAAPGGVAVNDPQIAQLMANDRNGDGKLTANEVPNELMPMLQGADIRITTARLTARSSKRQSPIRAINSAAGRLAPVPGAAAATTMPNR